MFLPHSDERSSTKQSRQFLDGEQRLLVDESQLAGQSQYFPNDEQNIQQMQNYQSFGIYTENEQSLFC